MGQLTIVIGSLWAVLGLGNIVLSGAWKTSGTTMQSAVLIFNFAVFILPGLIVVGVGAILEIKSLLIKLLAELEELNKKQSWTNRYLNEQVEQQDETNAGKFVNLWRSTKPEPEETPNSFDYITDFCSTCVNFEGTNGSLQNIFF